MVSVLWLLPMSVDGDSLPPAHGCVWGIPYGDPQLEPTVRTTP